MKEGTFGELLSLGYTYTVEVSGSLTEVGYGESYIVDGSFRLFDPDGNDVTANFDVIANPGTLYVSSPNALLIYLEAKKYVYTGKDIGFTNDEIIPLNLDTLPEGMKVSVEIIDISRRDVGKITSLDVNRNISKYIKYTVTNADGEDVTQFFELRVVDLSQYLDQEGVEDKVFKDYDLLTITTRSITITTASATKAADGTPLIADSYTISYGKLCDGHIAEIIVTGNIAEKGSVDNFVSISDCYITDEYGNIVFDGGVEDKVQNYEVTFILGKLTIT